MKDVETRNISQLPYLELGKLMLAHPRLYSSSLDQTHSRSKGYDLVHVAEFLATHELLLIFKGAAEYKMHLLEQNNYPGSDTSNQKKKFNGIQHQCSSSYWRSALALKQATPFTPGESNSGSNSYNNGQTAYSDRKPKKGSHDVYLTSTARSSLRLQELQRN